MGKSSPATFYRNILGKRHEKRLLGTVIYELKTMGFDEVFLWVFEDNHNARHFYEKCGFQQNGRMIETCIGGKNLKEVQYIRERK